MHADAPRPHLTLSADEMRALGYRVVDLLVDHHATLAEQRASDIASWAELAPNLQEPLPETGTAPAHVLAQLQREVFSHISHVDHPRFFAFIPSPSNFVSVMADALASGFNVFAGTWIESSGPAMIEAVTIDWLRQLCEMPETAGGLFTSGGSVANLTALAAARHVRLGDRMDGAVVYTSDQTHSSIDRALRILGFVPDQLRRVPSDEAYRLDLTALRQAVGADRQAGRRPFCVVANAGTTNTGAVDPLEELAALCREEDLWLHVDGAYGAAAVFCEQGQIELRGMGQAHSLALDPHKWLFQPYEIGGLLVRERRWLRDTFHVLPAYLKDTQRREAAEVNFADYGIQLTRSFRALKLWLSLKVFGAETFREAVAHGFHLAGVAERAVRDRPGWVVCTPAQLGIVTFRYAPDDRPAADLNGLNRRLLQKMQADGFAMLSSTLLRGRLVMRLCPINPRTTEADVRETLDRLDRFARAAR